MPYRAEVIGSMLRPASLLQARAKHQTGRLTELQDGKLSLVARVARQVRG